MDHKPEVFPFYMTDEDVAFFKAAGFTQVSHAEFRRYVLTCKQTIELMTDNGGYWTAHNGAFWTGPKALTCQAAFVAAELAEWGGPHQFGETAGFRMRRQFKETFTG